MLSVLFGALSKRKADDADGNPSMMLAACTDMFSPMNDVIGETTGLWKPVCKHPIILALAVKKLIATSLFMPSPNELREAIAEVKRTISVRASWLGEFLSWVGTADRLLFEFDRPAWEAAYAKVGSSVAQAMRNLVNDGPGEDAPPSPRWQALNAICKAKCKAEQAKLAPGPVKRQDLSVPPGAPSRSVKASRFSTARKASRSMRRVMSVELKAKEPR
jgi:hypothetical protein